MMSDYIHHVVEFVILYIRGLCEKYEQNDDVQPYMNMKSNILLDLLIITVCVTLQDKDLGEWEDVVQAVREEVNNYTEPIGEGLVRIVGGDGVADDPKLNRFYSWSLFKYTYILVREDAEIWKMFLWETILFPFIHKANKNFSPNIIDESEILLEKYPISDSDATKDNTLEKLRENHISNVEIIWNNNKIMGGQGDTLPSKDEKLTALKSSNIGWKYLSDEGAKR